MFTTEYITANKVTPSDVLVLLVHNAELCALYSSPNIIRNLKSRRLRWAGRVARIEQSRSAYRVLVGKPEGKRRLGMPKR